MECETNAIDRTFEDAFGSFGQGTPVSDSASVSRALENLTDRAVNIGVGKVD